MIEITGLNATQAENMKIIFGDKVKVDKDTMPFTTYTALITSTLEIKFRRAYNEEWDTWAHDLVFMKDGHVLYTLGSEEYIGLHVH